MNHLEHKRKTISGLKWNSLGQFITQIITFTVGILLMRLLTPNDYGLIGMVAVFSGFIAIFKDFGLTYSLIQKKEITDIDKNTIFYTNILVGLLLSLIMFSSAQYIALFYSNSGINSLAKTISIFFFINSFGMVHFAILKKQLEFKKIFIINFVTVIVGGAFGIYFAMNNFGVWTLIYQQIISSIFSVILVWFMTKWKPKFLFSIKNLKEHLKFGLPLFGSSTFTYWSRNADNLLIGKFLNSESLGLYSRAYNLMMMPIKQLSTVVSTVMMPSLSIIQEEKVRVSKLYLKIVRMVAFITFPMMGILFVATEPLIFFLFGDKWQGIIPLLKIFAFVGAFQSITTLNGIIYISQGRTKLQFKVNLFVTFTSLVAIIIGVQYNIYAVSIAYMIANIIVLVPVYYYMGRIINLSLKTIFLNLLPHLLSLFLMTILGILTSNTIYNLSSILQIIILTTEFLIGWFVLMKILNPKLYFDLANTLKDFRKNV